MSSEFIILKPAEWILKYETDGRRNLIFKKNIIVIKNDKNPLL